MIHTHLRRRHRQETVNINPNTLGCIFAMIYIPRSHAINDETKKKTLGCIGSLSYWHRGPHTPRFCVVRAREHGCFIGQHSDGLGG